MSSPRGCAGRLVVEHEVALVRAVDGGDLRAELPLEALHAGAQPEHLVLQTEHLLDAREVEADLRRQLLDEPETLDVPVGVEPRAARSPGGPDEPLRLVQPKGLRMHADELRGDGDHVPRPVGHQPASASRSRGFSRDTFWYPSSASRSAFDSFFGTVTLTRASRSPRPEPLRWGTPRPFTR